MSDVEGDEMLEKIVEVWSERNSLSASIEVVHLCYLLQPTLSCVEHALSMVKYSCTEQQSVSLVDLIETALMLQHNKFKSF